LKSHRSFPSDDTTTRFRGIISKTIGGGAGGQSFFLDWHGTNTSRIFRAQIGNVAGLQGFSINNFDFGTSWQHIAYTWNGSHHNLFINGVPRTPIAQTINAQISTAPLRIGQAFNMSTAVWHGLIDEVRIYNRALSAAEIMANFNATR